MNLKCECGPPYSFVITCEKDRQLVDFYQCPKCGTPTHVTRYKYHPMDGKHKCQFEHLGHRFIDDDHHHSITALDRCSLCGGLRETPRDTYGAGISGRVEIEDPRVKKTLLMNRDSWKRLIPKDLQSLGKPPENKEIILPKGVDI